MSTIKVYVPVAVTLRIRADGSLEPVSAEIDPEGSPFPNINGETYAPTEDSPDVYDWRDGTEFELMTADDYLAALLKTGKQP